MSGSHCLVVGCRNKQLINHTKSYYRFPRDANLCKLWVDFCGRPELYKKLEENGSEYLYKSSRVCSDHFTSKDFNNPNLFSQGLKRGSLPSINPPREPTEESLLQPMPQKRNSLNPHSSKQRHRPVTVALNKSLPAVLQLQNRPNPVMNPIRSILNNPAKKQKLVPIKPKANDEYGYGINYVDMDDPSSSDYAEPKYNDAVEDEYSMYQIQKPLMPKITSVTSVASSTPKQQISQSPVPMLSNSISNSNSNTNVHSNANTNSNNGNINYKEKYEQTMKELFACRKIVKNQNNAIKQLQGEIDFLNQLLKEK